MNREVIRFAIVFGVAALFALVCRVIFALGPVQPVLRIVSLAFIYTMPLSLGALVCFLGYKFDQPRRFWVIAGPVLCMALLLMLSVLVKLEAAICVVVAMPIALPAAGLGGVMMSLLLKRGGSGRVQVTLVVLLPFLVAPLEQTWRVPDHHHGIEDAVMVSAPAERIWSQIVEVPAIAPEELPFQWIYWLGFPKPIAAMVDRHGLGGKRHATFERDVAFFEEVTFWDPPRKLSFTIHADPAFIPHTAFDQHIIVGGRFYDVLDGTYVIEPLEPGRCLLRLSSSHRLSTPFNRYAGWWSEWVMRQIQGSILHVIRARCQQPEASADG